MLNKKLANIFLFFILNINLFAHKIPSVDISLTYLENDFFKIQIVSDVQKEITFANQIKIVSIKDNKVLKELLLTNENNVLEIPTVPYYVLIKINESLFFRKGIEPKKGFKKKLSVRELLYVSIVNILVRDVIQDFVMLVIQILETLVLNVEKPIFRKRRKLRFS